MSDVVERVEAEFMRLWNKGGVTNREWMVAVLSALRPGDVLPGGMVVVGERPTERMIDVGLEHHPDPGELWSAMLAAAKENDDAAR